MGVSPAVLFANALDVGAVLGFDSDFFAGVDEEGYHDFGTGFNLGGFEGGGGGGVALEAGFGVGDLEDYGGHELDVEGCFGVGVHDHFHGVAFLEELGGVDEFLGDGDLLEGFGVHHDVVVAFHVEELVGTALDAHGVDFDAGGEGVFDDAAGFDVLEFGAHEGGSFTGFDVLELHDAIEIVLEDDAKSVFEISCCCHLF